MTLRGGNHRRLDVAGWIILDSAHGKSLGPLFAYSAPKRSRPAVPSSLLFWPLLICLALVLLSVVTAAQTRKSPPPRTLPTPEGNASDATTMISSGKPLPEAGKQRSDACLLPPLDMPGTISIAVEQLQVSTKARREYQKACSALTKKKTMDAEQHLRKAVQEYPKYSAAWVTLGQVLADEHRPEDAKNVCSKAATTDPIYVPAHLCLAEIASRSHEWREELQYSNRALELDPTSILAYEYHAAANANLGNLDGAERSGLRAIELNRSNHQPGVYFLLARIYQLKGDVARAQELFLQYLKYSRDPQRAALAKQILAKLENGQNEVMETESETSPDISGNLAQPWEPADTDETFSAVVDRAPCPLPHILDGVGQRATELVENLQRFTATEKIEHTEFGKNGKDRSSTSELFSYVAEIEENPSGEFWVNEYRTAESQSQSDPPRLVENATAASGLIFHPKMIGDFEIHCEGQTDVQGMPAWQLRFEERPNPSKSFSEFRINGRGYTVRLKGRAWISADNYQVLRLQRDLVAPVPEINLQFEHSDIAFAPVEFAKLRFSLWLPKIVSMDIGYRGHHYQRVHSFSHFQLFLVDTEEKVKEPAPPTSKSGLTSNSNPVP